MKKLFKRFRTWLEDKISQWLFGETYADARLLIGVGLKFSSVIAAGGETCHCCGNVWYPALNNSGKDDYPAVYCPYCSVKLK